MKKDLVPASHEASDISGRFIAIGFASTIVAVIFLSFLTWALFPGALIDPDDPSAAPAVPRAAAPDRPGGGYGGLPPARIGPLEQRRLDRSGEGRGAYSDRNRDANDRKRRNCRLAARSARAAAPISVATGECA